MILEGLVTTIAPDGTVNIAPMGPVVTPDLTRFVLRPYRTSQTYRNLKAHGEGVLHVTDDVLLMARAALGPVTAPLRPAQRVRGWVLSEACRYFEFRVLSLDDRDERTRIEAEVLLAGRQRDFFGFNRAKHAVLEAAILATRTAFLPLDEIESEFRRLAVLVDKTGGDPERQAFTVLAKHVARERQARSQLSGRVRVTTASRLHFGLFRLAPSGPGRRFGGVGLMVEQPGIRLACEPAAAWSASGPLAERALAFARQLTDTFAPEVPPPLAIAVERAAPEHTGLGTGTQLALAVGQALVTAWGRASLSVPELARRLGRGRRSALGTHGFQHGGLLVDGGQGPATVLAPLLHRVDFPDPWRVVLVIPPWGPGWHGELEEHAFHKSPDGPAAEHATERLCRLALLGLLPALAERDWAAFGEALYEMNVLAGEPFRALQGSTYSHPETERLVAFVRAQGIAGVGQSSWGPAVFAVVRDRDQGEYLIRRIRAAWGLPEDTVLLTQAANTGAAVERQP